MSDSLIRVQFVSLKSNIRYLSEFLLFLADFFNMCSSFDFMNAIFMNCVYDDYLPEKKKVFYIHDREKPMSLKNPCQCSTTCKAQ